MIYLYGAYGTGNLGDEAILKGALERYRDQPVRIVAYGPLLMRNASNHIEHFEFLRNPGSWLRAGDKVIFAGGGLFWAASHIVDMRNLARTARDLGCTVEIERIGTHGANLDPEAVAELCRLAARVSVRDHSSVEVLKHLKVFDGAVYEPDFALCIQDRPPRRAGGRPPRVAINHSATTFFSDPEERKKVLKIYSSVAHDFGKSVDFVYVPQTRHFKVIAQNDVIYGEYFWNASKGLIRPLGFPDTIEDLLEYYAEADASLGWRYHLLVLSTLMGVPAAFVGSVHEHKYLAFARENRLPIIDMARPEREVIADIKAFITSVCL